MKSSHLVLFAAVAVAASTTSVLAQPAATPPVETCEEGTDNGCDDAPPLEAKDKPWHVLAAASVGFPTGVSAEAGGRLGNAYFYGVYVWGPPDNPAQAGLTYRIGVDGIFGKRGRGFAGGGMLLTHSLHPGDDEATALYVRIGLNAPITRNVSFRLWTGLGGFFFVDHCGADPECENEQMLLPLPELHVALAFRL